MYQIHETAIEGRFSVPCPASAWASRHMISLPFRRHARRVSRTRAGKNGIIVWQALPDKSGEDPINRPSMAVFGYMMRDICLPYVQTRASLRLALLQFWRSRSFFL